MPRAKQQDPVVAAGVPVVGESHGCAPKRDGDSHGPGAVAVAVPGQQDAAVKGPSAKQALAVNGGDANEVRAKDGDSKGGGAKASGAARTKAPTGAMAAVKEVDSARRAFLDAQRELLGAERSNYTRQAEELRAQAEALALEHEPGDVQFDEEGGEGGTAHVDRELDLHLSAQAHAAIEEIDAALAKLDLGTYGFCESCGGEIPAARLEALPHARLCVSCKSGGLTSRRQ